MFNLIDENDIGPSDQFLEDVKTRVLLGVKKHGPFSSIWWNAHQDGHETIISRLRWVQLQNVGAKTGESASFGVRVRVRVRWLKV